MKINTLLISLAVVTTMLLSSLALTFDNPRVTYQSANVRLIQKSPKAVLKYLKTHASSLKIDANMAELYFIRSQKSLIATHNIFQQQRKGIVIDNAKVIVSVKHENGEIYRVFNNTIKTNIVTKATDTVKISQDAAYDIVWQDLNVRGRLIEDPKIKLVYHQVAKEVILAFRVDISVENPFGYWRYFIDASTGKVLSRVDRRISRKKEKKLNQSIALIGTILDRRLAFEAFKRRTQEKPSIKQIQSADGKALVFDPDPRTALADNSLKDDSEAELFEPAYVSRVLRSLSFDGTTYKLEGPWVQIKDFESPNVEPTTSEDGSWSYKRGNNGFNDVMTYFHLDQNQRYIQSLGFVGDKGIQNVSVQVDSNGVGGQDNSHFVPSSNKIAFGHGCVDDNEDADVILHEYGHALHHSINSDWNGGDTGAMGEGFGDYWAASYSITTENGMSYYPNIVYTWDGHGEGNSCWSGRRLNVSQARYDDSRSYYAHASIGNNIVSDELWSTPLFQSLLELMSMGYPRDNVDKIILEAHFGLGYGVKMRQMAQAIVNAAQSMYPNDEYAAIFAKHFTHHNILDLPRAELEFEQFELQKVGENGLLDPGETASLFYTLKNKGTLEATNVIGTVSSKNELVAILEAEANFVDVSPNAQVSHNDAFVFELSPDAACGDEVDFDLTLKFEGGANSERQIKITIPTGKAQSTAAYAELEEPMAISDNDPTGVESTLHLEQGDSIIRASGIEVEIEITHTYIGDLLIVLLSPSGKEVVLHNKSGGSQDNLQGIYPITLKPASNLSELVGEKITGTWRLRISDNIAQDTGHLVKWGLKVTSGFECEQ